MLSTPVPSRDRLQAIPLPLLLVESALVDLSRATFFPLLSHFSLSFRTLLFFFWFPSWGHSLDFVRRELAETLGVKGGARPGPSLPPPSPRATLLLCAYFISSSPSSAFGFSFFRSAPVFCKLAALPVILISLCLISTPRGRGENK